MVLFSSRVEQIVSLAAQLIALPLADSQKLPTEAALAFSPEISANGSADLEAVKLWDLRTYREVFNLAGGDSVAVLAGRKHAADGP